MMENSFCFVIEDRQDECVIQLTSHLLEPQGQNRWRVSCMWGFTDPKQSGFLMVGDKLRQKICGLIGNMTTLPKLHIIRKGEDFEVRVL